MYNVKLVSSNATLEASFSPDGMFVMSGMLAQFLWCEISCSKISSELVASFGINLNWLFNICLG
ncbi:hypothetical protein RchiOBHm_Chr6g0289991 [Rosa chinensis]|uniref:Transcription factor WD40-like family n=1 Tax=Rosa chinensis TaxID=74649 RepID=A0A2P6PVQ6_ROSCH|nr:hypothetical protein RchiOBHm_Chr6g0289991 [Rosa chinensis]